MSEEKPKKLQAPKNSSVFESDKEIRIELPFEAHLDNMYYIGVNSQENWSTPVHYHDHFELCYLDNGSGLYNIDKSLYKVSHGELFLTVPGERHYGLAGENSRFRLYYLGFKLDQMRSLEADYYNIGINRVVNDTEGKVKHFFDLIFDEIRRKQPHSTQMVQGLFSQLLVTVLRLFLDRTLIVNNEPKMLSSPIIELMHYLHEEIRYDHNIVEIAKKLHISRSHLAREFKLSTGTTIGEYIRALCLDKAKFDLRETEKSISTIAEELHFTSIHTFSIFFKRQTGSNPVEYRKHTSYLS